MNQEWGDYNMDMFGIGNAVKIAVDMVRRVSRGTGRSNLLLKTVQSGDLVIFSTARAATEFRRRITRSGLENVKVISAGANINMLFEHYRHSCPNGRAILDHSWIEDYYSYVIEKASADINVIEQTLSGNIENRRQDHSNSMWSPDEVHKLFNYKETPLFGNERPEERGLFDVDREPKPKPKKGNYFVW
jgi:hypothetical protein|tara:strand:+ start:619 stop:1185 length:567 start_codon:yes stop_codon:yes gene_type:complete